jgi:hypothetical protein
MDWENRHDLPPGRAGGNEVGVRCNARRCVRAARCGPSLLTVTPYVEAVASAMLSQGWAEVAADVTEAHLGRWDAIACNVRSNWLAD